MNITTRTIIAIPMAVAALSAGSTAAMAQPAGPVLSDLDIAQPQPEPEPHPQPGPQDGPDDKIGPAGDPGPDGPDDIDNGEDDDPGPDGPDDLDSGGNDDDDDDGDNDDGDNDDGDSKDDDGNDVRRPTRVDAGGSTGESLSIAWLLASGATVTAAGGFVARRAALKRR